MRSEIRTLVRGAYDLQKLRIATGNRIAANFKAKLGQEPGEKEETLNEQSQEILKVLRLSYKRISDGIVKFPRSEADFTGDEIISTLTELSLVSQYMELEELERRHFDRMAFAIAKEPIYEAFLKDVPGIGPALAGVIVSEIDPHECPYPSSIWKYAGLDVAEDGAGRSRRKEHLVEREYIASDGTTKTRMSITFNPFLKTKLIGVLAPSFLRVKGHYAEIYNHYKNRLVNDSRHAEKTKKWRHNMAMRYMVKIFLCDLYNAWRPLEGLDVAPTYQEAKLGHVHGAAK